MNPIRPSFANHLGQLLGGLLAIGTLAGCASHAPRASWGHGGTGAARIASGDHIRATVTPAAGVSILDVERQRVAGQIEARVHEAAGPAGRPAKRYEIHVHLTRYEKGNAFARALHPGLGQIHIDGEVALLELPRRKKVAEFHLAKTFAWGGLYGAATHIGAVETGFAQGVANAVCGAER